MGGEWICLGVVDLLGIISFFLLSLVVRKLVVGYLKDTNAGECWRCEMIFAKKIGRIYGIIGLTLYFGYMYFIYI